MGTARCLDLEQPHQGSGWLSPRAPGGCSEEELRHGVFRLRSTTPECQGAAWRRRRSAVGRLGSE